MRCIYYFIYFIHLNPQYPDEMLQIT